MGLVHGHEGNGSARGKSGKARVGQALGGHIHEVVGTSLRPSKHLGLLGRRERGVEIGPANAGLLQGPHLIGHERHERAHHHGHARQHHGRHLIAHRLTRTRGHNGQRIAAGKHRSHHGLLTGAEVPVAEVLRQHAARLRYGIFPHPHHTTPLPAPASSTFIAASAASSTSRTATASRQPRGTRAPGVPSNDPTTLRSHATSCQAPSL